MEFIAYTSYNFDEQESTPSYPWIEMMRLVQLVARQVFPRGICLGQYSNLLTIFITCVCNKAGGGKREKGKKTSIPYPKNESEGWADAGKWGRMPQQLSRLAVQQPHPCLVGRLGLSKLNSYT
jgi:hypothetical protein